MDYSGEDKGMNISIIALYEKFPIDITVFNGLINTLKGQQDRINIVASGRFTDTSVLDFSIERELKSLLSVHTGQQTKKSVVKAFDEIYRKINDKEFGNALIIPISDWHVLTYLKYSYLQLSNKHILFYVDNIEKNDIGKFHKLVEYIDRYRNVHIGIAKSRDELPDIKRLVNLHLLLSETLQDVLKMHFNQRRKYIGWRHHVNELRQKLKFNKDLLVHRIKSSFLIPYKEKYDSSNRIPKVIHYCWFGGNPLPDKVVRCINTWKKVMPDYEIKCWNESNFPFEKYRFAQEALANKKWAFIADIARLHALYYEGGIYLDTDVEMLKPLDAFLSEDGFTSYESLNLIAMAAIGFKRHHPWIAEMLFWYDCIHCDDDYTEIANTKVVSKITKWHYRVKLNGDDLTLPCGLHIYTRDYFSPCLDKDKWLVTERTHCIHHFTGMW